MKPTPAPEPRLRRLLRALAALLACAGLASGALLLTWGGLNNRYLDRLNQDIALRASTPREHVLATFELVSRWQYLDVERLGSPLERWMARVEHASPFHVSARTTLAGGVDHAGPCGSLSRSMVVLLRRAGYQARKAILYSEPGQPQHTVVEVLLEGEWRVFDPTYGWYWVRPQDGGIATAEDLQDPKLLAEILSEHPQYPLQKYRYDLLQHLRWEKLPGLPKVRDWLQRWRGERWVQQVQPPGIYERPAYLMGCANLLAGFLGLALWGFLRRRVA